MRCRICGSGLNHVVVRLPNMPLTDDFVESKVKNTSRYIQDITIYNCDACGIVQNPHDFNHETYYKDYQYTAGHSQFAKSFMANYARVVCDAFANANGRSPSSVLEVGSGDGQQLLQFKPFGIKKFMGIEPSEYLAKVANNLGLNTFVGLFGSDIVEKVSGKYDICISSYTFDHVRNPLNYLEAANQLLVDAGIIALEIHDLDKIVERTEYCLFEHEHTIYLNSRDVTYLLESRGFEVISINPLGESFTRGNSLIVIAKKVGSANSNNMVTRSFFKNKQLLSLEKNIQSTILAIDDWINSIPDSFSLVGFGAGGRGVMTLAALSQHARFSALLDSNYLSNKYLTPKTNIPISGPDTWGSYRQAFCLIFSYGYYDEILASLLESGFQKERIKSLLDFYPEVS